MGYGRSTAADWANQSNATFKKTQSQIFRQKSLNSDMDPMGVSYREARDSDANPQSTPIIIACDVTGSMGYISEHIIKHGLKTLFTEIYDRRPVPDPAILPMAIGDARTDRSPLQVGQFESDIVAADWLEKIHIEGYGGGNHGESYDLAVYFAAYHTLTDAYQKRHKKGFLFTIGDEPPIMTTRASLVKKVMGNAAVLEADLPFKQVIERASQMYNYYHIIAGDGSYARLGKEQLNKWFELLGKDNCIWLEKHEALAETIVSIIQMVQGADKDQVVDSWSGDKSIVVSKALKDVQAQQSYDNAMQVVKL